MTKAEKLLTLEQLSDLVRQLTATKEEIASRTDLSGIWVASVCIAIQKGKKLKEFDQNIYTTNRLQGHYCDVARTLQQALAVSQKVNNLSQQLPQFNDIYHLLNWYHTQKVYTQELKISRSIRGVIYLRQIPGQLLINIIKQLKNLRLQWRQALDSLDENLADLVTGSNWSNFCHHPRHSTQFLSDALPSQIPKNSRVWFLIFDGMRLDSWDLIIRPLLEDHFQIEEKLYLTSLPSITDIARVALIAGETLDKWKNASGAMTRDHNFLAAKKFKITQERPNQELQIVVRSETIEGQLKLGLGKENVKKYNILIEKRRLFTTNEWIDLIITSIGFEPSRFNEREKYLMLLRLVPFVEANYNLIELGPRETGKTYTYRNTSSRSFVLSGSRATPATLFFNQNIRKVGILGQKDVVFFDEIAHTEFSDTASTISVLKDYMQTGRFTRGNYEYNAQASIVFGGNIDTDIENKKPISSYNHYFSVLPIELQDTAFIDRIHAFLPGWEIPKIRTENYAQGYGFITDYLAEIFNKLRRTNYSIRFEKYGQLDALTSRNQTAINKTASGLLKIIYPHQGVDSIEDEKYSVCIRHAIEHRFRVVSQLAIMAPEEFSTKSFALIEDL